MNKTIQYVWMATENKLILLNFHFYRFSFSRLTNGYVHCKCPCIELWIPWYYFQRNPLLHFKFSVQLQDAASEPLTKQALVVLFASSSVFVQMHVFVLHLCIRITSLTPFRHFCFLTLWQELHRCMRHIWWLCHRGLRWPLDMRVKQVSSQRRRLWIEAYLGCHLRGAKWWQALTNDNYANLDA